MTIGTGSFSDKQTADTSNKAYNTGLAKIAKVRQEPVSVVHRVQTEHKGMRTSHQRGFDSSSTDETRGGSMRQALTQRNDV